MLSIQKQEYGFIGDFGEDGVSVYGLPPQFEKEKAQELANLASNHDPIMPNLIPKRRARLKTLTEIAYFADTVDMIAPWPFQFCRTWLTDYSRERPFSVFFGNDQMTVDEALNIVMNGNGFQPSDDTRFLWELVHAGGSDSKLNKVPWVQAFHKDHVMLGILFLSILGSNIMELGELSDQEIEEKAKILYTIMQTPKIMHEPLPDFEDAVKRDVAHGERKIPLSSLDVMYFLRARGLRQIIEKKKQESNDPKRQGALDQEYDIRTYLFVEEFAEIARTLVKKRKPYTSDDQKKFDELVSSVTKMLIKKYQVTDEEFDEYRRLLRSGEPAPSQPYVNESVPTRPLRILPESADIRVG
ncbi:MAG: hypothetical protein US54_C0074G0003 [Candidatus Roizmanbacteria bacterium GW2011_GWA2_37_7]|uniref:Uncharacterized protein n=1 Tax=Candidatus Roizmanbacteria bacterium GW2011_GWA2_37_7 TaxID=1618481 RepID=A0A0G0H299_9BACT|nr:MAG: hypothetical protein US54_C0074G0003 [Candidatus Roizmanbacteria bacterium GW2011_GWA2_37_7]